MIFFHPAANITFHFSYAKTSPSTVMLPHGSGGNDPINHVALQIFPGIDIQGALLLYCSGGGGGLDA